MSGGLGIESVAPAEIYVTAHGNARIRVSGRGYGLLRIGEHRRWVWGDFDESASVEARDGLRAISILLRGLGGDRRSISVASPVDIQAPALSTKMRAPSANIRAPQARGIAAHRFVAPRTLPLVKSPLEINAPESEPTP